MFYDNFKRICEEKGTTPTTVMKACEIATSKITYWKDGSIPKQEYLVKLAEALNCTVMDFFWDGEDDRMVGKRSRIGELSDDEVDIISIYRTLDRKTQHQLIAKIYTLAK